jgi:3-oxoacyl-[acyl-carrier protein] reductase
MDLQLKGKTALVTGASAGIGAGIAKALAVEGVHVALCGRNTSGLDEVAAQIAADGHRAPAVIVGDVTAVSGPPEIAAKAAAALGGRVDILMNSAGSSRPIQGNEDDAFWEEAFLLNFTAARRLTERLVPAMRAARWGRVVNITGATVAPKLNATSPAKAALASWSRTLAFELGADGITVNTIAPGRINTVQILTRLHPTEQSRADYIAKNIPACYFGEPHDVADLATFLASPRARYISGGALPVDGGAVRLAL